MINLCKSGIGEAHKEAIAIAQMREDGYLDQGVVAMARNGQTETVLE